MPWVQGKKKAVTGKAEIVKEKNTTTLTLITCRHNTNRQIVVIFKQA